MKNSRRTVAKTEIKNLIEHSPVALSHSEIQESLNGLCDRVTIYRVLDRLLAENSIHKVVNLGGTIKYAACHSCTTEAKIEHIHHHAHFSCDHCHEVTCLENIEPQFQISSAYHVRELNFTISGICPNCAH